MVTRQWLIMDQSASELLASVVPGPMEHLPTFP